MRGEYISGLKTGRQIDNGTDFNLVTKNPDNKVWTLITEIFLEKLPTYLLESTASKNHGLACLDETTKLRKLHSISKTVSRHSK